MHIIGSGATVRIGDRAGRFAVCVVNGNEGSSPPGEAVSFRFRDHDVTHLCRDRPVLSPKPRAGDSKWEVEQGCRVRSHFVPAPSSLGDRAGPHAPPTRPGQAGQRGVVGVAWLWLAAGRGALAHVTAAAERTQTRVGHAGRHRQRLHMVGEHQPVVGDQSQRCAGHGR
jgi:hypothetical protein